MRIKEPQSKWLKCVKCCSTEKQALVVGGGGAVVEHTLYIIVIYILAQVEQLDKDTQGRLEIIEILLYTSVALPKVEV